MSNGHKSLLKSPLNSLNCTPNESEEKIEVSCERKRLKYSEWFSSLNQISKKSVMFEIMHLTVFWFWGDKNVKGELQIQITT